MKQRAFTLPISSLLQNARAVRKWRSAREPFQTAIPRLPQKSS